MPNPEKAPKKIWTKPVIEDLNSKNNEGAKSYNDNEAAATTGAVAGPS